MGSCSTKLALPNDFNLEFGHDNEKKLLSLNLNYELYDKAGKRKIDTLTSQFVYGEQNVKPQSEVINKIEEKNDSV